MESALLALGLLVFIGHVLVAVFKRTRVPDVLLLIGIGILLGPVGVNWVQPEHFGLVGGVMTAIALAVILFEGGLDTELASIGKAAIGTASITFASAAATVGLIAVVAHPYFGGWMPAFLAGAVLSGTSSAVVMPMIAALKLGDKARTILALESALTDVTCIVLTVGLLDAMTRGDASGARLVGNAFASLISAGVIGLLAGIGWLLIHKRLREVPNTRLAIIAGVLVLYGAVEAIGFSGGIAALAFGVTAGHLSRPGAAVTIAGQPIGTISQDEKELFNELVFLCKLVFFIYLGISLRFDSPGPYISAGVAIGAVYLARVLLTRWLLPRDCSVRDAAVAAIMAPKGLAAAVLASTVAQALAAAGLPMGEEIKDFVYAAVLVSIVGTSVLVPMIESPPARWLACRFFSGHTKPT